jgi:hypothetical protein
MNNKELINENLLLKEELEKTKNELIETKERLKKYTTPIRNKNTKEVPRRLPMNPTKTHHKSRQIVLSVKISGERPVDLKVTINGEQITSPKRGMNSSCTC